MEPLHPSSSRLTGRYFASAQDLGPGDEISNVDFDPFPGPVASDSVRMCWTCEATIYPIEGDFVRASIRYEHNYGHGTNWAYYCDAECWAEWAGQTTFRE